MCTIDVLDIAEPVGQTFTLTDVRLDDWDAELAGDETEAAAVGDLDNTATLDALPGQDPEHASAATSATHDDPFLTQVVRGLEAQAGGNSPMAEAEDRLDQAGHPRRGVRVADTRDTT